MTSGALLTVAGFDPTGGAGVMLDTRVFARHGFQGLGLCTALTVQNTQTFENQQCLSPELVLAQFKALDSDMDILGLKVGMLGCREHIATVSSILERHSDQPVVVDPVIQSSSGAWLLDTDALPEYLNALAGRITLLTPNLSETAWLTGSDVCTTQEMHDAAHWLYRKYRIPTLIKGGHLNDSASDILFDGRRNYVFEKARIEAQVHGTGCFLSSTILCLLVKGVPLPDACRKAGDLAAQAIRNADPVGKGQRLFKPE
jgi:hydroxymethylpyrimidine/phosphomethylpyrimidine kinase